MWCGPYALALISGLSYDEAYTKTLRMLRRGKPAYRTKPTYIKGMYPSELVRAGRTLKCPFQFKDAPNVTLNKLMDELRPNRIYIVFTTDHFLVVDTSSWTLCDNWTQAWVPVKGSVHARKKIQRVAEVKHHKVY